MHTGSNVVIRASSFAAVESGMVMNGGHNGLGTGLERLSREGGISPVSSVQQSPRSDLLNASWNLSNASDTSVAAMQMKDEICENRVKLERETSARNNAEEKMKILHKDKQELAHKTAGLNKLKSNLEQKVVDLEAQVRSLQYSLTEESEQRKNAELLHRKTKEQLERKESQFTQESETRQKTELNCRNLMMEVKSLKNKLKQLEDDREDLSRQLDHERSARSLDDQMHQDQVKIQYQSLQQASPGMDISSMDPTEGAKLVRQTCDKLKTELYASQMELERVKAHQKDDHNLMEAENDRLQKHVNDLKQQLKLNQEALTHATMQYNSQMNSLKTESGHLQSSLEKDQASREKTETEYKSLKTRWQNINDELTKTQTARSDLDRSSQRELEASSRQKERSDLEVNALRDANQSLTQRAHDAEKRSSALENELSSQNSALKDTMKEKANLQRETGEMKVGLDNNMITLNKEKEDRLKFSAKVEALQDRNQVLLTDSQSLKQRIDQLVMDASSKDKQMMESQNKFADLLTTVRGDYDKSRTSFEEKNASLQQSVDTYKDQLREAEQHHKQLDQELRSMRMETSDLKQKIHQAHVTAGNANKSELEDLVHKLEIENTRLESSLKHESERVEILRKDLIKANKARENLESENKGLRSQNDRLDVRVTEDTVTRTIHGQDAQETPDLSQSEVKVTPIDSLGTKLAQLEKEKLELANHLDEERTRTKISADREKVVETKLETIQEKNLQLEREMAAMKAKLKMANQNSGTAFESDEIRQQLQDVQQQLHDSNRSTGQQPYRAQQLQHDLQSLKAREKALMKAEKAKKKLQEQYEQYQEQVRLNYVPRAEFDRLRSDTETQARKEINSKLDEVNNYLAEQASARERLDHLRYTNEQQLRTNFHQKQKDLQEDLTSLRANYQELLIKKTSQEGEVHKLKTLFDSEHKMRERLEDRLFQSSPPSKLTTEMLRPPSPRLSSSPIIANGHVTSPSILVTSSNGLMTSSSPTAGLTNQELTQRIRNELNRSIAKHLESPSRKEMNLSYNKSGDDTQTQYTASYLKSSNDYKSILHRNYLL